DITEAERSGNLLLPDLKVKGTIRGTELSSARVVVSDDRGRVVHEESLDGKIERHYAAAADRAAPASISYRVTVDGKRLAGARGDLSVTVRAADRQGRSAEASVTVER
ncbi:MAG TPA: hypothetical protein VJV23_02925, partial [Candidatus Polarisedimenticolia bacterium]|nr:hypothetical protein [Candidatus Polarisedimenticolia bacterium]